MANTLRNAALANPVTTALAATGTGTRYDVGPGQTYTECDNIPWATLGPGDVVNIHYRAAPYVTKFGVRAEGTAANRVIINGVTDASGNRPQINGAGATTAPGSQSGANSVFSANYLYGELLGVIVVKARPAPPGVYSVEWPGYLTIQNLEVFGSLNTDTWTDLGGVTHNYSTSAGIYLLHGHDIVLKNNKIHDNGFGIFCQEAKDTTGNWYVRDLRIEGNQVYNNGVPNSFYEHNLYVQAVRPWVVGNYIGQTIAGSPGSSYKSRSAGEVFAYNTVVASARACDFVHAEGQQGVIDTDPQYGETWCFGNLIVNDLVTTGRGAAVPVHFGCDQSMEDGPTGSPLITDADLAPSQAGPGTGVQRYAKRNLFFYNNTYVTRSTLAQMYTIHLFDLSLSGTPLSPRTTVWEWDNTYQVEGTSNMTWVEHAGNLRFMGGSKVYSPAVITAAHPTADAAKYALTGVAPAGSAALGFTSTADNDYMPLAASLLDGVAVPTPTGLPGTWVVRSVDFMPNGIGGGGLVARASMQDVGAFENSAVSTNNPPVLAVPLADASVPAGATVSYTMAPGAFTDADGGSLTWSAAGLPAGLVFDPSTRTVSGPAPAAGTYTISITVTDPAGATATDAFNLTVAAAPPSGANMIIIQKADLAASSFANTNTNAAGGISVRTDAGSAVKTAIDAAIAALPAEKYVTAGSYDVTTDTLNLTLSDSVVVAVPLNGLIQDTLAGVPSATDTLAGKVALAISTNYPALTNDVDAATPAYVEKALAAQDCVDILAAMNYAGHICTDGARGAFMFSSSVAPDLVSSTGVAIPNPWTVGNVTYAGGGVQSSNPTEQGELRQLMTAATSNGPEVPSWLIAWSGDPTTLMHGSISYDANGAITTAAVQWPDGGTGVYTATTQSTLFPGSTDAYTVTYVGQGTGGTVGQQTAQSGVTRTVTQPAVTRDANGRVTVRPLRTVA